MTERCLSVTRVEIRASTDCNARRSEADRRGLFSRITNGGAAVLRARVTAVRTEYRTQVGDLISRRNVDGPMTA